MKRAFILTLDTAGDTDFIGLADEIRTVVEKEGMTVLDCKPWASPGTLDPSLATLPVKPPTPMPPPLPPINFNLPPS